MLVSLQFISSILILTAYCEIVVFVSAKFSVLYLYNELISFAYLCGDDNKQIYRLLSNNWCISFQIRF